MAFASPSTRPSVELSPDEILRLLRCLFVSEDVTGILGLRWVDGAVTLFDVTNYSFLIDNKRGPVPVATFLIEDSVVSYNRSFEITK